MTPLLLGTLTLATLALGGAFGALVTARSERCRRDEALDAAVGEVLAQVRLLLASSPGSAASPSIAEQLARIESSLEAGLHASVAGVPEATSCALADAPGVDAAAAERPPVEDEDGFDPMAAFAELDLGDDDEPWTLRERSGIEPLDFSDDDGPVATEDLADDVLADDVLALDQSESDIAALLADLDDDDDLLAFDEADAPTAADELDEGGALEDPVAKEPVAMDPVVMDPVVEEPAHEHGEEAYTAPDEHDEPLAPVDDQPDHTASAEATDFADDFADDFATDDSDGLATDLATDLADDLEDDHDDNGADDLDVAVDEPEGAEIAAQGSSSLPIDDATPALDVDDVPGLAPESGAGRDGANDLPRTGEEEYSADLADGDLADGDLADGDLADADAAPARDRRSAPAVERVGSLTRRLQQRDLDRATRARLLAELEQALRRFDR